MGVREIPLEKWPELVRLTSILRRLHDLRVDLDVRKLSEPDNRYLIAAIGSTYNAKLRPVLDWFVVHRKTINSKCNECGGFHEPLPESLFGWFDRLEQVIEPDW